MAVSHLEVTKISKPIILRAQERLNVQKKLAQKRVILSLTIILHR